MSHPTILVRRKVLNRSASQSLVSLQPSVLPVANLFTQINIRPNRFTLGISGEAVVEAQSPSELRSKMSLPEHFEPQRRANIEQSRSTSSFFSTLASSSTSASIARVIFYDPSERRLWVDNVENVVENKHIRVPIPGTKTKVQVHAEIGLDKTNRVFEELIDLSRLGKWVKVMRKKGKLQYLYVVDVVGAVERQETRGAELEADH